MLFIYQNEQDGIMNQQLRSLSYEITSNKKCSVRNDSKWRILYINGKNKHTSYEGRVNKL